MTPMHVTVDGHIFQTQPPGGISRTYLEILPRMIEMDPDVRWTLIAPLHQRRLLPGSNNVRFVPQLPTARLAYDSLSRRIAQRVNLEIARRAVTGDTLWHTTQFTVPPVPVRASVATIYDLIYEFQYNVPHELHLRTVKHTDHFICTTHAVADQFSTMFDVDPERISIIPLGCEHTFRPLPVAHGRTHPPSFLYVGGRANDYKNFDMLLHAFAAWPHSREALLTVAGPPWTAQERRLLHELHLSERVRLVTDVDDERLCRLYNEAQALVYPSRCEGFGLPLLEAIACECQIVASRIPTTVEVVGQYPFLFNADRMDSLIDALDCALMHPKSSVERQEVRAWAASTYSWDRNASDTLALFRALA